MSNATAAPASPVAAPQTGTGVPTPGTAGMSQVIDALRSVQSESDRWKLADALAKKIPSGLKGFDEIVDAAKNAGVAGKLKVNTLRQYRDTSVRWKPEDRVPEVSFTAHKEAQNAGTTPEAKKLLERIVKQAGADGVSVGEVRRAVSALKGKTSKGTGGGGGGGKAAKAPPPPAPAADIVKDLSHGGGLLIAAIPNDMDAADLSKLIAGIKKVLGHAERLQMKAANKANAGKNKPAVTPIKREPVPVKQSGPGDIRGM